MEVSHKMNYIRIPQESIKLHHFKVKIHTMVDYFLHVSDNSRRNAHNIVPP